MRSTGSVTPRSSGWGSAGIISKLLSDRDGSVGAVFPAASGAYVAWTCFDVYGNPTSTAVESYTRIGFQGRYGDPTGLVYFQHRPPLKSPSAARG